MSQEILIQELRRKSSDRVREMWSEAEKKLEKVRSDQEEAFTLLKKTEDGRLQEVRRSIAAPIVHEAEVQALQMVDDAMRKLSERLYAMALDMLSQVRQENYPEFFAELVGELPPFAWESVTVNELDKELARMYFPDTAIQTDPGLSGGFMTSGDNGRYRVVNTLERRLEKAWPFALPVLLAEITGERDASSAG